tara:strand:+ start:598 stop:960 length:363 start_codon:yes stop_codon:yes gene_type:complete
MDETATLMSILAMKHFLADYVFNPPYTVPTNKHIYGSRGSLEHSGVHMLFCFIALVPFASFPVILYAMLFDGFVHYHEDFIKTKYLHKRKGLGERVKRIITGFDQLVHILTYVVIVWWLT